MKMKRNGIALFLLLMLLFAVFCGTAAADNDITAVIPVDVYLKGALPKPPETYSIVLKPEESWYPMPDETEDGVCTIEITGEGHGEFVIPCPGPGVFKYTVWQIPGEHPRGTYDPIVYNVTVTFFVDERTGQLTPVVGIHRPDMEEKPDNCYFENSYSKQPVGPQTDDNSGIRMHQTLTCCSAAVLVLLFLTRKGKKSDAEMD